MREILVLQGSSPNFRLAAWVLKEEGFSVRVVTPQSEVPHSLLPDICVLNAEVADEEGRNLLRFLRSLDHACFSIHLAGHPAHTPKDCGCDICLLPPHNANTLLTAIAKG